MGFVEAMSSFVKEFKRRWDAAGPAKSPEQPRAASEGFSIPQPMSSGMGPAEILQEPSSVEERIVYKVVSMGEGVQVKEEKQVITQDGAVKIIKTITIPVAVCGRRLRSEREIAGFCAECQKAVCREHAKYCSGFEEYACQKIFCVEHVRYYPSETGENLPCCPDHYNMRGYFRKNPPAFEKNQKKGDS